MDAKVHIGVDEVYARSPQQKKECETRDDLFITVIVDLRTHKVIWVSKSRRKEALDTFFARIGTETCEKIEVIATDQPDGYGKNKWPTDIRIWPILPSKSYKN